MKTNTYQILGIGHYKGAKYCKYISSQSYKFYSPDHITFYLYQNPLVTRDYIKSQFADQLDPSHIIFMEKILWHMILSKVNLKIKTYIV